MSRVSLILSTLLLVGAAPVVAPPVPSRNGELPAVSPNGAYIAFESDRDGETRLYVMGSDGSGERGIAGGLGESGPLAWAGSGRILFSRSAGDSAELLEVGRHGGRQRSLAIVPGRGPRLSPDGRRLVYMAGTYAQTRLTVCAILCTNPRQISDGLTPAWNPQWSPDGTRIAFTSRDRAGGPLKIFVVNADGTGRRQVTTFPDDGGNAQWPVWSPDGTRLAIQLNQPGGGDAQIWIVDLATLAATPIAGHDRPYLDETPSWFPDGRRLAIQSNRTGRMEIWVIDVAGSGARQLTR